MKEEEAQRTFDTIMSLDPADRMCIFLLLAVMAGDHDMEHQIKTMLPKLKWHYNKILLAHGNQSDAEKYWWE